MRERFTSTTLAAVQKTTSTPVFASAIIVLIPMTFGVAKKNMHTLQCVIVLTNKDGCRNFAGCEGMERLVDKTCLLLFESHCNESQIEKVKCLLNVFINEKMLPPDEIVLAKVHENAIILKSPKIIEKGFPLVYFIKSCKFFVTN